MPHWTRLASWASPAAAAVGVLLLPFARGDQVPLAGQWAYYWGLAGVILALTGAVGAQVLKMRPSWAAVGGLVCGLLAMAIGAANAVGNVWPFG